MTDGQAIATLKQAGARLYYVDNLRILLAVLVIMQHAGQPYGPGGGWWIAPEPTQFIDTLVLGAFFAVNMSFFMGLFFMISAYFVPGSYDRKGAVFFKDRIVRLGIPLVVFALAVFPAMLYLLHGTASFESFYLGHYLKGDGFTFGHLWFLEQLLIFSGFYVVWRGVADGRIALPNVKFPGNLAIASFAVLLGISMFIVRIWSPINHWIPLISIEPAHYPEYVALFIIGLVAYRNDWLNTLPASTGRKWGNITGLAVLALFPIYAIFGDSINAGGLTVASLVMSLWEAVVCVGMCIGLVALFRGRLNARGKLSKALSDSSFTVYLIHIPIIVFLQWLLIGASLPNLAKFAIVCLVGVPLCFILSHYVVRRLPYAKNIL